LGFNSGFKGLTRFYLKNTEDVEVVPKWSYYRFVQSLQMFVGLFFKVFCITLSETKA